MEFTETDSTFKTNQQNACCVTS